MINRYGIVGCTHFPGQVPYALEFVQDTCSDWKVNQMLHAGDLTDYHYISRHPLEPDASNPIEEWKAAKAEIQRWYQAFPNMIIASGNHDKIPVRQLKTVGMPEDVFLQTFNAIYDTPLWTWVKEMNIFENTLVDHGEGSGGMYGAKRTANALGCSYIQAHTHAHGAVFNLPRPYKDAMAMNVGCLMDESKYFARYGERYKTPVSLGMGICLGDSEMYFIKYKG